MATELLVSWPIGVPTQTQGYRFSQGQMLVILIPAQLKHLFCLLKCLSSKEWQLELSLNLNFSIPFGFFCVFFVFFANLGCDFSCVTMNHLFSVNGNGLSHSSPTRGRPN